MRSKRYTRKGLKSEITTLNLELDRVKNMTGTGAKPNETADRTPPSAPEYPTSPKTEIPLSTVPKIAALGFPIRGEPIKAKTLKEAKSLLLSLNEW